MRATEATVGLAMTGLESFPFNGGREICLGGLPGWRKSCPPHMKRLLVTAITLVVLLGYTLSVANAADSSLRHSYLVLGGKTAIIGEDGQVQWEYRGGSRDGFVLPSGNVLIAYSDRVEEVTPAKQVVFSYERSADNSEIGTTQRLYNGNTLVTEGPTGRIFEVTPQKKIVWEYINPAFANGANAVYRAYRVPYGWVPQLPRPVEQPVTPPGPPGFRSP